MDEDIRDILRLYHEDITSLLKGHQFLIKRLASINKLLFKKGVITPEELTNAEEEFQIKLEEEKGKIDALREKVNNLLG